MNHHNFESDFSIQVFSWGRDCHGGADVRPYLQSEWCQGSSGWSGLLPEMVGNLGVDFLPFPEVDELFSSPEISRTKKSDINPFHGWCLLLASQWTRIFDTWLTVPALQLHKMFLEKYHTMSCKQDAEWCFSPSFRCPVWKQRTLQGGKRLAKRQNYLLAQPASQYFDGMC